MDLNTVSEFAPATVIGVSDGGVNDGGVNDGGVNDAAWRDGDAWLGGGTWLFSQPQPRLRRLLDLSAFGWPPLAEGPDGLTIAATCTLAELARWQPARPGYRNAAALARQCCDALLGSFKVANVATVGGNLCLSLPAGPMIALAAALDGVAILAGRQVAVADFVTGDGTSVLRPGELLTHVRVPAAALTARTAFRQRSLSPAGRSAVLVIGRRDAGGATAVTVTASVPRPLTLRFPAAPGPGEAVSALDRAAPRYLDDVHGNGPWRAAMTRRAVAEVTAEVTAEAGPRR